MSFHISAEGGVDVALIAPALCFEEIHHVRINSESDLSLFARPQDSSREEIIIELGCIGKVDIPVLQGLNLCPVCF